ncbi:filament integrity protein FraC [Spirulina subsalsa]|uniref:filament integrity protein FraC n=1 Tax=Spirulina subsalsa TaxID=54311 RepID=UPI0002DA8D70|nr:filament integrity protein FraC [Spirulina subsalsa]
MAYLIPFPLILLQSLTLLISIAIEAMIYQNKLNLNHKRSVEFSVSVNLLSAIFLWISFSIFLSVAPDPVKMQLMSYVLFSNFYQLSSFQANLSFFVMFLFFFVLVCVIEFKGLDILQALLLSSQDSSEEEQLLVNRINKALLKTDVSKASVIVLANICSNSVILLVVLFKILPTYD